jgi:hypothetical protein
LRLVGYRLKVVDQLTKSFVVGREANRAGDELETEENVIPVRINSIAVKSDYFLDVAWR